MLREKLDDLRLAISDQNLELIPDYEQRLDVLRELKFVDENSTVLLKGRVACEVGPVADPLMKFDMADNLLGPIVRAVSLFFRSTPQTHWC